MRFEPSVCCAALLAASCGCAAGAAGRPAMPGRDLPVPDSVPRAEMKLTVDLYPAAACEENFDLELYRDRRVDLVQWDDSRGKCSDRQVVIRYLGQAVTAEALLAQVQKIARRATPSANPSRSR